MRANAGIYRAVLAAAMLGMAVTACDRSAPDQASDTSGSSQTAPRSAAGTSGGASTASSAGAAIDDSIITTKVKTALLADAEIKGSDISVETKQGEVLLSGFVDSPKQAQKAVQVANAVEGVKKVNNKVTVKQ